MHGEPGPRQLWAWTAEGATRLVTIGTLAAAAAASVPILRITARRDIPSACTIGSCNNRARCSWARP